MTKSIDMRDPRTVVVAFGDAGCESCKQANALTDGPPWAVFSCRTPDCGFVVYGSPNGVAISHTSFSEGVLDPVQHRHLRRLMASVRILSGSHDPWGGVLVRTSEARKFLDVLDAHRITYTLHGRSMDLLLEGELESALAKGVDV